MCPRLGTKGMPGRKQRRWRQQGPNTKSQLGECRRQGGMPTCHICSLPGHLTPVAMALLQVFSLVLIPDPTEGWTRWGLCLLWAAYHLAEDRSSLQPSSVTNTFLRLLELQQRLKFVLYIIFILNLFQSLKTWTVTQIFDRSQPNSYSAIN